MKITYRLQSPRAPRSLQISVTLTLIFFLSTNSTLQAQPPNVPEPPRLEPVRSSITVVERVEAASPAFVTVLQKEEVQEQPGINLDDRLRSIPGFTLFRRSSSLVANPTTQGVSLRGLGSSGASRSLVLWDGIPLNDPFGGWIYWTRVAPDELERVEISRGAATSVFGDRAMSGALALFSRPAQSGRWTAGYEGGNLGQHLVSLGGSHIWKQFAASANVRTFTTDGYYIVPENRRGQADTPANVNFVAGDTRFDYTRANDRLFLKLDILAEHRDNGSQLTENSTSLGTLAAHYIREVNARDSLSLLGYHTRGEYRASFSSISADRNTERITFLQTVPSEDTGLAGMWRHGGARWDLLGGADMQRVEGYSSDRLVPTGLRFGGGTQWQQGTFGQANVQAGPLKLFAGLRHQFTGQDSRFWSPSAGVSAGRGLVRVRGSVYRSFRAPTLNELFRDFRAGNAETRANAALRPETLFGAEAGVDLVGENFRVSVTMYRHDLEDIITNVTLSSTPQLIVRQRQNAQGALARGADTTAEARWRNLRGELGYLFADSRFSTGQRIPQVARHQANAQLSWVSDATLISVGVRRFSSQFEDDRNQFLLPQYKTTQVSVRQRFAARLWATGSLENAFGRQFLVGFSPVPLIGNPRLWRVGLRWGS